MLWTLNRNGIRIKIIISSYEFISKIKIWLKAMYQISWGACPQIPLCLSGLAYAQPSCSKLSFPIPLPIYHCIIMESSNQNSVIQNPCILTLNLTLIYFACILLQIHTDTSKKCCNAIYNVHSHPSLYKKVHYHCHNYMLGRVDNSL